MMRRVPTDPAPPRMSKRTSVFACSVLALAALIFLGSRYVIAVAHVDSASMSPTLGCNNKQADIDCGSRVDSTYFVDKVTYRFRSPRDGEIVTFQASPAEAAACGANPEAGAGTWVKRVLAVGGQTIGGRHGRVYRDGKPLSEPYIRRGTYAPVEATDLILERRARTQAEREYWARIAAINGRPANPSFPQVTVPTGYVFVAGDNRAAACDSRVNGFGFVPLSAITGRVIVDSIGPMTAIVGPIASLIG